MERPTQVDRKQEITLTPEDQRRKRDSSDLFPEVTFDHLRCTLPPDARTWLQGVAQKPQGIATTAWLKNRARRAKGQGWQAGLQWHASSAYQDQAVNQFGSKSREM